jgi:hypothetical protein
MKYDITFVPMSSSHIAKNISFLELLRQRGHRVRILCMDRWLGRIHAALPQIRETNFDWEEITPINVIPREARTMRRACYGRKIARAIKTWIEATPSIDLFIFASDTEVVSQTFIKTARESGIPSVLVLDGLVLPDNPNYVLGGGLLSRLRKTIAHWGYCFLYRRKPRGASSVELILAINETSRQALIAKGVPKNIVEVVGSPEYDALAATLKNTTDVSTTAIRKKLGIVSGRPVVFYAHQKLEIQKDGYRQIVKKLTEGCSLANAILLVKFHPRSEENISQWKQWIASLELSDSDIVFVRDACTSIEAIQLCDVCVTVHSTIALEALVNSRLLLILRYPNTEYFLPYAQQYDAALDVFDEHELPNSIVRLIQDTNLRSTLLSKQRDAITRELVGLDGKSAERSALAIEILLAKHAK